MAIDTLSHVDLSNSTDKQLVFVLDQQKHIRYVLHLLPCNKICLLKLDDYAQVKQEWIDLLRLDQHSPLLNYCLALFQFELPTYILAWRELDGSILIELPRHQLSFRLDIQKNKLFALQFNGYALAKHYLDILPTFNYQLVLQNDYDEYKILLPHVDFTQEQVTENDPLCGNIYSSLHRVGSPSYFAYTYQQDFHRFEANSVQAEQYLALLYAKSHEYTLAYDHLMACWKDQLLSPEEWQLFRRYFTETESNAHPDNYACRLQYFLRYSPIYTLLNERLVANDTLTITEKEQLAAYKDLSKIVFEDYENYLRKWIYVNTKLHLTITMEKELLTLRKHWPQIEQSSILHNRAEVLSQIEQVTLITPSYKPAIQSSQPFILSNNKLTKYNTRGSNFYSLSYTTFDFFGYSLERPIKISDGFLTLYQYYREKVISASQLTLILRTLVLAHNLTSTNSSEFELLQLLLCIGTSASDKLPPLPFNIKEQKSISFHCEKTQFNSTEEAKQLANWFQQLLLILQNNKISLNTIATLDTQINLHSKQAQIKPRMVQPNTLPVNSKIPPIEDKMVLTLNPEQFEREYGFDPQMPLKKFSTNFFILEQDKIPSYSFPLSYSENDKSDYAVLLHEDQLAKNLFEHFQSDYNSYQVRKQDKFVVKPLNNFTQNLHDKLMQFLYELQHHAQSLLAKLYVLANKNPCERDIQVQLVSEMQQVGLQIKYTELAQWREKLIFVDILTLLISQNKNSYLASNIFLSEDNIATLTQQTLKYLLVASATKQVKRVLVLISLFNSTVNKDEKQSIIEQIGKECFQKRHYEITNKLPYLLFEYLTGYLLWEQQVQVLENLRQPFKQQIEQLIMGGGKSSLLAPILGYQLADGKQLMVYTIPASLIAIFTQLLRKRFRGALNKRVHTLSIQRTTLLTPNTVEFYLKKIQEIITNKDVLVITPDVPNCLLLKWIEIAQQVHQGKRECRAVLEPLENLLCLFEHEGRQLIDELDLVLAPLKSELNFTDGEAKTLEPAPLRWSYAQELLLLLLTHQQINPILGQAIAQHDCKAHGKHPVLPFNMLELINVEFYHRVLKRKLAEVILNDHFADNPLIKKYSQIFFAYLLGDPSIKNENQEILLQANFIKLLTQENDINISQREEIENLYQLLQYNVKRKDELLFIGNTKLYLNVIHPLIASLVTTYIKYLRSSNELLADKLILAKEWLTTIFPHVLQKRLFIHYGPYFELITDTKNIIKKRSPAKKLAIPYLGKDIPSKRSEFQHPDVVIAFTCLQYLYSGLAPEEFNELILCLQNDLEKETATVLNERKAAILFRQWQRNANLSPIELHHLDLANEHQINSLYSKLFQILEIVQYYLDRLVFPHHLKVFPKKWTSNSFDLAAMLFNVTKGFSGTVHNYLCLPNNLLLNFQDGADGSMFYTLNLAVNQTVKLIDYKNDKELLKQIDLQQFRMLIDAGGLIQRLSNFDVARQLLSRAPDNIHGIVFVDDSQQQLRVLVRDGQVQIASECSILPQFLFKYVDHAHTTGTDMPQFLNDRGLITLNSQTTLRELFQAAKRLRLLGIHTNQSIVMLLRKTDAKQLRTLLNLKEADTLTSQHILRWTFANTITQVSQELQVATYQRLHAVIRKRAYQLLLGKCSLEKLPKNLTEENRLQLWDDLHGIGLFDSQNRVRHEVKASQLNQLENLSTAIKQELQYILTDFYRYRFKQEDNRIVRLCLEAFSEDLNTTLIQALPLDICEHTSDRLESYHQLLTKHFGDILFPNDHKQLRTIISDAKLNLPRWITSKQLQKEVEKDQLQIVSQLVQIRQQQGEQQSEKVKQQQQEKQNQHYGLFKPVPRVTWQYQDLTTPKIHQLITTRDQLKTATKKLRLLPLQTILPLPFSPQLLVTENFLRTEEQSTSFHQFAKNIHFYLELQEAKQSYFILIDMHEAGYLRHCLTEKLLDEKSIGLRLLSGILVACSKPFVSLAVTEMVQIQLYFLNGTSENEIPKRLNDAWQAWKSNCDQPKLQELQQQLKIALAKH